ncbi:hypothetical protein [Piscinibacter sp.]|uniref:hypothetical protein n=1 Tax=Piscinibacter sp. TaxID=1903157 RepID=UPI0039E6F00E
MRGARYTCALLAAGLLGGCAAGEAFAPSAVPAAGMPYAGLAENSYGARSTAALRACDGQEPGSARLAAIAAIATRPAQGLMKIDATLASLDLAAAFTDPTGSEHPPVAVLSHAGDGIVFWHSLRSVPLAEVGAAARAYCAGRRLGTLYRGSASRCPTPQRGLSGAPVVQTHVISAYACTGRP